MNDDVERERVKACRVPATAGKRGEREQEEEQEQERGTNYYTITPVGRNTTTPKQNKTP